MLSLYNSSFAYVFARTSDLHGETYTHWICSYPLLFIIALYNVGCAVHSPLRVSCPDIYDWTFVLPIFVVSFIYLVQFVILIPAHIETLQSL